MKRKFIDLGIRKEKVQIDMNNLDLKGDIIDVGIKNYGIIYKLCKQNGDEIAVEYVEDEEKGLISKDCYDTAVLFFSLGQLSTSQRKKRLLKEIHSYIRDSGEIVIWDVNKNAGKLMDLDMEILMPQNETQTIKVRMLNPFSRNTLEQVKKMVEPMYEITDEREGNDIFYLRGIRKGRCKNKDESSIDRT